MQTCYSFHGCLVTSLYHILYEKQWQVKLGLPAVEVFWYLGIMGEAWQRANCFCQVHYFAAIPLITMTHFILWLFSFNSNLQQLVCSFGLVPFWENRSIQGCMLLLTILTILNSIDMKLWLNFFFLTSDTSEAFSGWWWNVIFACVQDKLAEVLYWPGICFSEKRKCLSKLSVFHMSLWRNSGHSPLRCETSSCSFQAFPHLHEYVVTVEFANNLGKETDSIKFSALDRGEFLVKPQTYVNVNHKLMIINNIYWFFNDGYSV